MLKMFHQHESAGNSSAYWESMWGTLDPGAYAMQARRHCELSPIWKLVTSKVRRDRLFIDGGCGHGYWVKYFHDLGQNAVGVDFADNTLDQIRRIDPKLDLRIADVRALPFRDEEVHVYYSGGVVEHFEDGPAAALAEARRVVAPDGWFLCSVPQASPFRRHVLYRSATETRGVENGHLYVRRASVTEIDSATDTTAYQRTFFQYVFEEGEFRALLRKAGFDVVESFGESLIWGLLEVDAVRRLSDRAQPAWRALRGWRSARASPVNSAANPGINHRAGNARSLRALPRRLLLNEDRSVPVLGAAIGLAAAFAANLRMYVARPSRS